MRISSKKIKFLVGLFFIIIGVVFNEWACAKLISPDRSISFANKILIWMFNFCFNGFGIILIKMKEKKLLFKISSVCFKLFDCGNEIMANDIVKNLNCLKIL